MGTDGETNVAFLAAVRGGEILDAVSRVLQLACVCVVKEGMSRPKPGKRAGFAGFGPWGYRK
jgi:hypothetical protein